MVLHSKNKPKIYVNNQLKVPTESSLYMALSQTKRVLEKGESYDF